MSARNAAARASGWTLLACAKLASLALAWALLVRDGGASPVLLGVGVVACGGLALWLLMKAER